MLKLMGKDIFRIFHSKIVFIKTCHEYISNTKRYHQLDNIEVCLPWSYPGFLKYKKGCFSFFVGMKTFLLKFLGSVL